MAYGEPETGGTPVVGELVVGGNPPIPGGGAKAEFDAFDGIWAVRGDAN